MNRTMQMPAVRAGRYTAPRRPALGELLALVCAYLQYLFGLREVKTAMRMIFGGGSFVAVLGIIGGIECGTIALLPGVLACLPLFAAAYLLLRKLGID